MKSAVPVGLLITGILSWVVYKVTKKMSDIFPDLMKIRDKRTELTSSIIEGIKSIKYLCWESIFQGKLFELREKEFSYISKLKYLDCYSVVLWGTASLAIITGTFITYSLAGYNLADANIFTVIKITIILFKLVGYCLLSNVNISS